MSDASVARSFEPQSLDVIGLETTTVRTESTETQSTVGRVLACSIDDLGRLTQVLQDLGGRAAIRGTDGASVPVAAAPDSAQAGIPTSECTLSAPIYDSTGTVLAFLDVAAGGTEHSDASRRLLAALTNSVARDISERWFRVRYRRYWVVAALRRHAAAEQITLAVDREQRIVGADRPAREFLRIRGECKGSSRSLGDLFHIGRTPLRGRRFCDSAMTLRGVDDGAAWAVTITPPDFSADPTGNSQRVLLHARPRLGFLMAVGLLPGPHKSGSGLPPRMFRRVNEYIDAHLDSALNIPELAETLGISESHFARGFRNASGLTPHSYVMRRRLLRAQELLVQTNLPLVNIALATGFADQSHFSRRFHELTGVPPRAFRDQNR